MEKKILNKREKPVEFSTPEEEQSPPQMITPTNGGWEQKVWGKTRLICLTPQRSIHELILGEPGSFCSIHYHERRHNIFSVLSGMIQVTKRTFEKEIMHLIPQGKSLFIPAGMVHQFKTITEGTHLLEIYLPVEDTSIDADDIVRQHEGGLIGQPITLSSYFLVSKEVEA